MSRSRPGTRRTMPALLRTRFVELAAVCVSAEEEIRRARLDAGGRLSGRSGR